MKICGIVTGGKYSPCDDIEKCDYIIACDKGYQYCKENNIKVDLLIGDFDSYQGTLPANVETITLPVEKDDTDTMHGYRIAIEKGFDEIYLYCALGGRLDHLYANLQTAAFGAEHHIVTRIIDQDNPMIISYPSTISLPRKENYSLSIFALDECKGVTIQGAKYEVNNVSFNNRFPIGESNEWASDTVTITVQEGIFIIINSKL